MVWAAQRNGVTRPRPPVDEYDDVRNAHLVAVAVTGEGGQHACRCAVHAALLTAAAVARRPLALGHAMRAMHCVIISPQVTVMITRIC